MAEQGGYRKPGMPAAVSGPGKYSQRTDGQPGTTPKQAARYVSGLPQGEGKAFNSEVVGAAPMAAAPSTPTAQPVPPMPMMKPPTPLTAPTERPNEPLTAGVDFGDGPGAEVLQYPKIVAMQNNADLQRAKAIRDTLAPMIDRGDASNAARLLFRKLDAMIPKENI
jgi:hypothetical protein